MAGAEHRTTRDSPSRDVEDIICDATTPIAIVGIGCRLPGGHDEAEEFHQALLEGLDAMLPVPPERWDAEWLDDPKRCMGCIKGFDQFDARFFGISPIEAQRMDPQHRIMLEASVHAFQDAGVKLSDVAATRTGVFVGCAAMDFSQVQFTPAMYDDIGPHSMTGTSLVIVSNRVSYLLDLRGPSFTVDSACSSALLGVHLAVAAIRRNECTAALAGGANILGIPTTIGFARGGFLSPDGHCKAFDASGNGFARAEGSAVIYLKPLPAALRDGNRIYSVILGTATNEDGLSEGGMTHPSGRAQKEVIVSALKDAKLDASKIMYAEAHGTGTSVGDPIEATALGTILGTQRPKDCPLLIGSVKTNVGHLEAASGMAGIVKLALAMENRLIPGNNHLKNPNSAIDWKGLNVKVPTAPTKWPATEDEQIYAGINSFGYGGANVHAVLSGPPLGYQAKLEAARRENIPKTTSHCLCVSARSYKSLAALAAKYSKLLSSGKYTLAEVCAATNATRDAMEMRAAIVATTTEEAVERLNALAAVETDDAVTGVVRGRKTDEHKLKTAWVCTGQGPQWPRMTVELMEQEPVFANVVREIAAEFAQLRPGFDLIAELELPAGQSHVNDTLVTQPSLMAVQIGLYELWRSRGVDAQGIVGHSIGEVAAAYISGALTLKQACYVMHHRSRVQARASGKGKMLAVGLGEEEASKLLPEDGSVSIGAANSPTAVTLSGDSKVLETIQKQLEARRVFARFLRVDVPFHSRAMEPLKDDLLSSLADLVPSHNREGIELWSTVTGKPADGTHAVAEHWYGNVRGSVLFERAIRDMVANGYNTFIELSPHPALATYISETVRACKAKAQVVSCMRNLAGVSQSTELANAEAKLFVWGVDHAVTAGLPERRVRLPLYIWDRERYWQESSEARLARVGTQIHPHLRQRHNSCREIGNVVFDVKWNIAGEHAYLKDHMINNQVLVPAAAFTDLAISTGHAVYGDKFCFVEDLHFSKALFLPAMCRVDVSSDRGCFYVYSRPPLQAEEKDDPAAWVLNCSGRLNALEDSFVPRYTEWTLERLKKECTELSEGTQVYESLEQLGLTTFGPCFKCLRQVWSGPAKMCLARIELPKHIAEDPRMGYYYLHPAMMDAGFVSLNVPYEWDPTMGGMLPHSLGRGCIKVHNLTAARGPEIWAHGVITEITPETLTYDVRYMTADGEVVAELQGFKLAVLPGSNEKRSMTALGAYYSWGWTASKDEADTTVVAKPGKHLLVTDGKADEPVFAAILKTMGEENCEVVTDATSASMAQRETLAGYSSIVLVMQKGTPGNEHEELDEKPLVLLHLSHALMRCSRAQAPRMFTCVTRGSQQAITMEDTRGVAQSGMWGMARTLMMEATPATDTKFAFVDAPYDPSEADVAALVKHVRELAIGAKWISESAVRLGAVLNHVLQHEEHALKARPFPLAASGGEYVAALPHGSNILKSMRLEHRPRRYFTCPDNSAVIAVKAAALNFRDVMCAAGMLPPDAIEGTMYEREFGLECAGIITEVGKGSKYKVGDEVVSWTRGCLSGKVVSEDIYMHHKPSYMTFDEATALPGVYSTAYLVLVLDAQIKKGEWLLLHSAAGGVGIAAINIAKYIGAKVIATASPGKHEYLRSLGVEHVFNSGSLSWHDEVMRVTGGHGADVILNSLSGKAITQGMRCLARRGRFIEIGKTDIYRDSKISMRLLAENCKYFATDVDKLMKQDPEFMSQIADKYFALIDDLHKRGELMKHHLNVFPVSEVNNAFVALASGKTMGKVVLSMTQQETVTVEQCEAPTTLDPHGTYMVTGGTSGFGLWTANWLVSRGAGRVLLLDIRTTARADAPHDKETLDRLINAGKAVPFLCDTRNLENVKAAVARANEDGFVLRGLFHCAVLFDDKPLANIDIASMRKVAGAKALGAWNLHLATRDTRTLELFVMYSSITAVVGNAAQINYGNANAFLDGLARYRSAFGLPGTSINWGPIAMRGYLTRAGAQGRRLMDILAAKGMIPISGLQAEATLARVITEARDSLDRNQLIASVMDWSKFDLMYSAAEHDSRFRALMAEANAGTGNDGKETVSVRNLCLKAATVEECQKIVSSHLQVCIARITGAPKPEGIDVNVGLPRLGLDSLMTNQLQSLIFADIGVDVPLLRLVRGPSITTLSQELATEIQTIKSAADVKPKTEAVTPAASPSPIPVTPSTSPFLDFTPPVSPAPGASAADNTKRDAKIDIHVASPEEATKLFELAVREGWSYNLEDAKIITKVNPNICVAVTVDGKWAGGYCASFWKNRTAGGPGFGWICMYYVTPESRDTGAGADLGMHMFKTVKPGNIYGGCSVNHILDTYKGYGFMPHHNDMYFWQDAEAITVLAPGQILEADLRVVEASTVPFEKIDAFDQTIFMWDRSALIKEWISWTGHTAVVALGPNDEVIGYAVSRQVPNGQLVCPFYASSKAAAASLMLNLSKRFPGVKIGFAMDPTNPEAVELTNALGFKKAPTDEECSRVYFGGMPQYPHNKVYGALRGAFSF